uniref:Putative secreted protein n=1 Tax=Anopheles darlingi TaxID=43151 RepID=A0A2M4D8P7_ANODA
MAVSVLKVSRVAYSGSTSFAAIVTISLALKISRSQCVSTIIFVFWSAPTSMRCAISSTTWNCEENVRNTPS